MNDDLIVITSSGQMITRDDLNSIKTMATSVARVLTLTNQFKDAFNKHIQQTGTLCLSYDETHKAFSVVR
jgi:hypothetical protein